MTSRFLNGFAALALASGFVAAPALAKPMTGAGAVRMIDTDSDGTVDLKEAQAKASATFDRLEGDSDGTLDAKELKGRLSKSGLKMADPDSDGTLDAKELNSKAGKALLALIR